MKLYKDLRPENILIDTKGDCMVSNYGYSWASAFTDNELTVFGNIEYFSPEIFMKQGFSKQSDFWALGIVLYEAMVGVTPFSHANPKVLVKFIMQLNFSFPDKLKLSIEAFDFFKRILHKDPTERLGYKGIQEIMDHDWFKDILWKEVSHKTISPPVKVKINPYDIYANFKTVKEYFSPDSTGSKAK